MRFDRFVKSTTWKADEDITYISPLVHPQQETFPTIRLMRHGESAAGRPAFPREPSLAQKKPGGNLAGWASVHTPTPTPAKRFTRSFLTPAQMVFVASNAKRGNPLSRPICLVGTDLSLAGLPLVRCAYSNLIIFNKYMGGGSGLCEC